MEQGASDHTERRTSEPGSPHLRLLLFCVDAIGRRMRWCPTLLALRGSTEKHLSGARLIYIPGSLTIPRLEPGPFGRAMVAGAAGSTAVTGAS